MHTPGLQSDVHPTEPPGPAIVIIIKTCKAILSSTGSACDVFIPRHTIVVGHYGITLAVRVSARPSVRLSIPLSYILPSVHILFQDDNLSKFQWIFTKRCVHRYCGDLVWDC